jgi:hypothetical protein
VVRLTGASTHETNGTIDVLNESKFCISLSVRIREKFRTPECPEWAQTSPMDWVPQLSPVSLITMFPPARPLPPRAQPLPPFMPLPGPAAAAAVRCMRSCRPFSCGEAGRADEMRLDAGMRKRLPVILKRWAESPS